MSGPLFGAPRPGRFLCVGDVMRDVVVRPEGAMIRGADRRAHIEIIPGGAAANQAAWLAALGAPAALVSRVGAADMAEIEAGLSAAGVTPILSADPGAPTGAVVAQIDPDDGQRSFFTSRGANDRLCPADLSPALLDGACALVVSGYALVAEGPRIAVADLIGAARARALPVIVDPGSASFLAEIGPERFFAAIDGVQMLFPNRDEAAALTGSEDRAAQEAALAARAGAVILKDGAGEAALLTGGTRIAAAPPPARALDTTGAGDSFLAGFLAAWARGAAPGACLAAGHAAAGRAVTRFGARP
ncbi:carbohydrate kinase family protein [Rhodovulum sp. DZ06]|uniref:carbohydrate kinase family protein n=1 Tax=Rhodovulum sp. DZ06 TaxID=3425126 RepID=UPI003D354B75